MSGVSAHGGVLEELARRVPGTGGRILAGTACAVTAGGIAATSVQDVLDAADVSRRTFYQYYRGMDGALEALYALGCEHLVASVESAPTSGGAVASSMAALDRWLDALAGWGPLATDLQVAAMRSDSGLGERRADVIDALARILGDRMGGGVDLLLYRALVLAVEALVTHLAADGSLGDRERARVRAMAEPVLTRLTACAGDALPPLPRG